MPGSFATSRLQSQTAADVKVVALLALEVATGLTMDQLGGETEALLGSTFLEAPHRRTRELFVVKLTEDLQIPDELHQLDVGSKPIWEYKDQFIPEMHYSKGKAGSGRGLIGLQSVIGRAKSRFERSHGMGITSITSDRSAEGDNDDVQWDDIGF